MALSVPPRSILDPTGRQVRRRRVDRLSERQLAALREAFAAVQQDGTYRALADDYARLAPHHTPSFLPWNRAYLRAFEAALLERVPGVALPWWDWVTRPEIPPAFIDYGKSDNPLAVIDLPQGGRIQRGRGKASPPQPPGQAELRGLFALADFAEFSARLEELHDLAHVWVGTPLDDVVIAAYDPLFWPLQAWVDRCWRVWQQRNPEPRLEPDLLAAPLEPFGVTVADVLDPRALGYDYADLPRAPRAKDAPSAADEEPWRPALPGYHSDDVPAVVVDQLGIEPEVEALCWVIAAQDTCPPLSVGLFGEWGSGKSTFMALMRQRIAELADQARERPDGTSAWCRDVHQITFNAWTYADDNLWASLVAEIFTALAAPATYEPGAEEPDKEGMLGEIARRRSAAEERRENADARIDEAQQHLADLPDEAADATAESLATATAEGGTLAGEQFVKDVQDAVGTKAADAVDQQVRSAGVFTRLAMRGRALRHFLRGDGAQRRRGRLLLLLALVLAVALVVLFVDGSMAWILTALGAVASAAAAIKPLLDAEQALRAGREEAEQRLKQERQHEEQELAAAREERARADELLARIESGRIVRDYFAERAASPEYRGRMGIVSTVRRDLSDMRAWLRDTERQRPDVDRIVLYVDDLDRCGSERVVEVLEAVHLLLALDLFVVVVGVDPRWLLGSLEQHYEAQFAGNGAASSNPLWRTTPQNFLEKIFQIPFSLRPMDTDGFRRLVRNLLPAADAPAGQGASGASSDGSSPAPAPAPSSASGGGPALASSADLALEAEEPDPAGLRLDAAELRFLGELCALVPTPRAAKRLANTYRLLRAPLDRPALDALIASEHRPVLALLAALVGFPESAARLLAALLAEPPEKQWTDFLGRAQSAPLDVPTLRLVHALWEITNATGLDGTLEPFQRWTPRVARYSFETARLAADPLPARP